MRRRIFLPLTLFALMVVVAACGSSTTGVQATIGPSGGSLSLANPAITFDVPAGALGTDTLVSLRASSDPQSLLVILEPSGLVLGKPGQLSVSLNGARHITSVTEVSHRGEQPIGVDARIEDSAGATARLRLDHLTQVRLTTTDGPDGGMAPGACREHDDDDQDGEHHRRGPGDGGVEDGGHHDGEHHDGGVDDDDEDRPDGGVAGAMACPVGFECDDGVCVAHGGNHEHEDDCRNADGGSCPDDDDDGEHRDGGHD